LLVAPGQTGLPAGMSINQSGTITGTPASPGTCPAPSYRCTFAVSDSEDRPQIWSLPWTIYPLQQLSISMPQSGPGAPPAGTVGLPYTFTFTAIGGVSPYTWPASGLPDRLTIDPASGEITGIPTKEACSAVAPPDPPGSVAAVTPRSCGCSPVRARVAVARAISQVEPDEQAGRPGQSCAERRR
jgi:hypothetical protein